MMNYALLVWEMVPEDTEMYLIPEDVAAKYGDFLRLAHGNYINGKGWQHDDGTLNQGLRFLNFALSDEEYEDDGFEQYKGLFTGYKVDMAEPIVQKNITTVYH